MRNVRVKITRDQNTVYNRAVPAWEIPLLEFIFEPENVQSLEEFEKDLREVPSPGMEYDRLMRCYGSDPQSGIPHVASVYGNGQNGIRALAKVMKDAVENDSDAEPAPTPVRKRKRVVEQTDSLLN
jgi:hypothetical protein